MDISTVLYLIDVLASLSAFSIFFVGVLFVALCLTITFLLEGIAEARKLGTTTRLENSKRLFKWLMAGFIFFVVLVVLLPSEKTMYLMLGSSSHFNKDAISLEVQQEVNEKIEGYLAEDKK